MGRLQGCERCICCITPAGAGMQSAHQSSAAAPPGCAGSAPGRESRCASRRRRRCHRRRRRRFSAGASQAHHPRTAIHLGRLLSSYSHCCRCCGPPWELQKTEAWLGSVETCCLQARHKAAGSIFVPRPCRPCRERADNTKLAWALDSASGAATKRSTVVSSGAKDDGGAACPCKQLERPQKYKSASFSHLALHH